MSDLRVGRELESIGSLMPRGSLSVVSMGVEGWLLSCIASAMSDVYQTGHESAQTDLRVVAL
ncbi:MAG: hypothetical protein WCG50_04135 [Rhodoferax sp.]|uniref:hypothetical protein n=1 Tax=Rhodoferax sp. TaxID=50421 RepID=UPI0030194A3C